MGIEGTYVFANNRAGVGKSTSAFELVSSFARKKQEEGIKYVCCMRARACVCVCEDGME